ncbi:MAG: peptidylprolyl isomerase [Steroidobacteraceae bacterium]
MRFETNLGQIEIELFEKEAPISSANFRQYVDDAFYDGTIFHRVIPGFVIQGGGLEAGMAQRKTRAPIRNESDNGLKNLRGTLSMARTNDVDSATSQFFINLVDNDFLNHNGRQHGYAVFGCVTAGMDVVDSIAAVPTTTRRGHQDVPRDDVTVMRASLLGAAG